METRQDLYYTFIPLTNPPFTHNYTHLLAYFLIANKRMNAKTGVQMRVNSPPKKIPTTLPQLVILPNSVIQKCLGTT